MPYIKPATATHASAGIRRMEAELPLCAKDAGVLGQRGRVVVIGHGLCQNEHLNRIFPQRCAIAFAQADNVQQNTRFKTILHSGIHNT